MRTLVLATLLVLSSAAGGAQAPAGLAAIRPGPLAARSVVPAMVACADRPTIAPPAPAFHVVAAHRADGRAAVARGEIVVLSAGIDAGFRIGQTFFTRRLQAPVSRERMGPLQPGAIRTTGWLTVIAADARVALARIDYACTAVEAGDYLEPYEEQVLPSAIAAAGPADFADLARVLFGPDRRELFGAGDLLSIDRGAADGTIPGTRVGFYRDRGTGTPLVEIGEGIVIDVAAGSAKVVVERSSGAIVRGDYVAVRAPAR